MVLFNDEQIEEMSKHAERFLDLIQRAKTLNIPKCNGFVGGGSSKTMVFNIHISAAPKVNLSESQIKRAVIKGLEDADRKG